MKFRRALLSASILWGTFPVLRAQHVPVPPPAQTESPATTPAPAAKTTTAPGAEAHPIAATIDSSMQLGPGDRVTIAAPDLEELDKRELQVQPDGTVSVPFVGSVKAAGLTPQQFAQKLTTDLKSQFLDPQITFSSVEIKSQPVSVLGAVNQPGIQQADGRRRLSDMLSLAGGIRQDAGPIVKLTRRADDASSLPAAVRPAMNGDTVTAQIPVTTLLEGSDPVMNIVVKAGDVITIPKGRLVYVIGDVHRSGGFVIGESDSLTVLKALSLAEGFRETADLSHARILRENGTGTRVEQSFNVKKLLNGQTEDTSLKADDVLYIPSSALKKLGSKALDAGISAGTGILIWRR
jgi:polysaccharide biosynthesis/export protein